MPFSPRAAWSVLGVAAFMLIGYQDLHHARPVVWLEPRPAVTVTAPARASSPPSVVPSAAPVAHPPVPAGGQPIAHPPVPASPGPSVSTLRPSRTPGPSPTGPGPSSPVPLAVVAVTVSPRHAGLLGVQGGATASAAPPFPGRATADLVTLGVRAMITLR